MIELSGSRGAAIARESRDAGSRQCKNLSIVSNLADAIVSGVGYIDVAGSVDRDAFGLAQ